MQYKILCHLAIINKNTIGICSMHYLVGNNDFHCRMDIVNNTTTVVEEINCKIIKEFDFILDINADNFDEKIKTILNFQ
jgi:hypothetical protein